ncbi:hypothetical protein TWF481_005262 [Arthrobotrys musiformis]|uniref:Uncharacterized protein n=1 Tax=Arthrobotrys musiformis TaxID=47236 RepID=A0AAV9WD88_9PEZI
MYLELIIFGTGLAAFMGGMLAVEACKTLEDLYNERRTRIKHEIATFGRPLKRKERYLMRETYKLDRIAAARARNSTQPTIATGLCGGRGPEIRKTPTTGSFYSNVAPKSALSKFDHDTRNGPFAHPDSLYIYDGPANQSSPEA